MAALNEEKPERKTRRVQMVFRPSTWAAVEEAAAASGFSRNDWAEIVLASAASAALEETRPKPAPTATATAADTAATKKSEAARRERTQPGAITKADLVNAAAEKLGAKY